MARKSIAHEKKVTVLPPLSDVAREVHDAAVRAPQIRTYYPGDRIPPEVWELVQRGLGVARNEKVGAEYAWRFVPTGESAR